MITRPAVGALVEIISDSCWGYQEIGLVTGHPPQTERVVDVLVSGIIGTYHIHWVQPVEANND